MNIVKKIWKSPLERQNHVGEGIRKIHSDQSSSRLNLHVNQVSSVISL